MGYGAIVIGAGHNGLICAAYLARAGVDTVLLEARDAVGGQASTQRTLGGAAVNICNCDHVMFRTTPIADELALAARGLRYLDVDPAFGMVHWDGGPAWFVFHDLDRTLESLRMSYPDEVEGYRRYAREALPMMRLITELASSTPTPGALLRHAARRPIGAARSGASIMAWSRRSVAEVARSFFTAEQVRTPMITAGPSVWGVGPEVPGTGLGALGYATKHIARTGRPVGGSGALPDAVRAAFEAAGGTVRFGARVEEIVCEGDAVRGVRLAGGEIIEASVVVSAADSHRTLVSWLAHPPAAAKPLVDRYRAMAPSDGYEAKVDVVLDARYTWPAADESSLWRLGLDRDSSLHPTFVVSKSIGALTADHAASKAGRIAEHPQFLVQLPSALDATVASALSPGHEVFSLEVLWAPYALAGGWQGSTEPARWLDVVSELVRFGDGRPLHEHVVEFRLMGPEDYDRDFHMPRGHSQSYAGTPLRALLARDREQTRYETPVRGLFLTGAGTYPGAGVWGASGRNAATAVLSGDARTTRARRAVARALAG